MPPTISPLLEKEIATHSSILAWRIPWTEEPGGLLLQIHWFPSIYWFKTHKLTPPLWYHSPLTFQCHSLNKPACHLHRLDMTVSVTMMLKHVTSLTHKQQLGFCYSLTSEGYNSKPHPAGWHSRNSPTTNCFLRSPASRA